jgi:hypothetical protein
MLAQNLPSFVRHVAGITLSLSDRGGAVFLDLRTKQAES